MEGSSADRASSNLHLTQGRLALPDADAAQSKRPTVMSARAVSAVSVADFMNLAHEHRILLAEHGATQQRCSKLISAQQARIEALESQMMRLRAAAIVRQTALAFAREDRAALEASIPDLPTRVTLARRVETLLARIHVLMREHLRMAWRLPTLSTPAPALAALPAVAEARPSDKSVIVAPVTDCDAGDPKEDPSDDPNAEGELGDLAASLVAADLVICQTGCLSHGDYWRVKDHCKRTGKACVLVTQPDALRIVRIERNRSPQAATQVTIEPCSSTQGEPP